MDHFAPLQEALAAYLEPAAIASIRHAFEVAEAAHTGQKRSTGEDYITHPVAVAKILAELKMDPDTLMAALLHDVIEDTSVDKATLIRDFGPSVADLVDGVSKLTQIKFESKAQAQAENFRKMVLAMAKDLRVIVVKLADRLHNMSTLAALRPDKARRIARETLDIYAPIANRLGMHRFRIAFEDLGFAALYPYRYKVLKNAVKKARGNRLEIVNEIEIKLTETLTRAGIPPMKLWGREKHLFSIYKKMRNKRIPFSEIMDVYAFRIIVNSVDTCYRVLGAVHNLYKPVPERFKDYIAIPKANGYQSLHTTLFGPYGVPLEIQIRTEAMENLAESGVASHWLYKTDDVEENQAHVRAQEWLQRLLDMQQSTGNSLEFIENVKIDLFPDEVYVFTPKGTILELPNGSSAVDFAYAIHTDIGNTAVAAKIDRRLSPLSTQLANGQTVEIVTSASSKPNPAWLNFVVTARARSAIRHFLKRQKQSESIYLGKRLIERALGTLNLTLDAIPQANIRRVLKDSHLKNLDELLESLGFGHLSPLMVARRLAFVEKTEAHEEAKEKQAATEQLSQTPLLIEGTEGMVLQFATCCYPIPGDPIIGVLDAGRGIVVHTQNCSQITKLRTSERCIYLSWQSDVTGEFPVSIDAELLDRKGVLAALTLVIAECDANIENITVSEADGNYSDVTMVLTVKNRQHLAKVMRQLKKVPEASKILRTKC